MYATKLTEVASIGKMLKFFSASYLDDMLSQEARDKLHEDKAAYRNRAVFLLKSYDAYDLDSLKDKRENPDED